MWENGFIKIKNCSVRYWVKVCDEPTDYGINGGRISKLTLKDKDGTELANYDRGWDIKPVNEVAEIAVAILEYDYDRKGENDNEESQ